MDPSAHLHFHSTAKQRVKYVSIWSICIDFFWSCSRNRSIHFLSPLSSYSFILKHAEPIESRSEWAEQSALIRSAITWSARACRRLNWNDSPRPSCRPQTNVQQTINIQVGGVDLKFGRFAHVGTKPRNGGRTMENFRIRHDPIALLCVPRSPTFRSRSSE